MTKRILVFFSCVLCAVLLISCSQATPESSGKKDKFETEEVEEQSFAAGPKKQSVTDHALSVQIAGQEFAGYFTGTLNEGIPEGEGRFKAEKLIYKGTFQGIEADTGTVGGYPLTVQFSGSEYTGIYQGDIVSGKLTGTGSFTSENLLYDGSFENGVPTGTGSVTKLPVSITISAQPLSGSYTGPIAGFLPEGEGSFEADKTKYSGTFSTGAAQDGNASDLAVTIKIAETDYIGFYTGPVAGGALTGDGTFTADQLSYSGSFETGALKDGTLANFPLKVTVQGTEISGIYNGPVAGGVLTGDGTFTADQLSYSGSFETGALKDGTLANFPLKVTVQGTEISGIYNGPVASGALTGDGSFSSESLTYTGSFDGGTATGNGTFSSISATITFQDRSYTGTYAGQASSFLPNGEGSFDASADSEGYYLSFSGSFSQGALGTGTLKTNYCTLSFKSSSSEEWVPRLGTYEGPLTDGALTGTDCFFSTTNGYNIPYDLKGTLLNGSVNGTAVYTYHMPDGDLVDERTCNSGLRQYTTVSNFICSMMITKEYGQNRIPLDTFNFIKAHEQAFRCGSGNSEVEALVSDVPYMQSYSDPAANAGKVIKVEGAVCQGFSLWDNYPGGYALYWMTLTMPDDQTHVVWLGIFGTLEEMTALQAQYTKGQTVNFIAVPLQPEETDQKGNLYQEFLGVKLY